MAVLLVVTVRADIGLNLEHPDTPVLPPWREGVETCMAGFTP